MYRVFKRVESTLKNIILKIQPYIEALGEKIINDENLLKDPILFTKELLSLKADIDIMVSKSFQEDIRFQKCRDESFQNFMNRCDKTPGYIASYCDNEMKNELKGKSEQQTDSRLEAIIRLFCCLHGRDIFIKVYTKFFAIRLLNKTFISKDAELAMLQKLKIECGHNTVNKLSSMLNDINISKDLNEEFKKTMMAKQIEESGIIFNAEILTSGHWPDQHTIPCILSDEMKNITAKFEVFYKQKY